MREMGLERSFRSFSAKVDYVTVRLLPIVIALVVIASVWTALSPLSFVPESMYYAEIEKYPNEIIVLHSVVMAFMAKDALSYRLAEVAKDA